MTHLNRFRVFALSVFLAGTSHLAMAGVELVQIEKVQVVKTLLGVVCDATGVPIPGATVSEVAPDWKTVIQTTTTDADGKFAVTPQGKMKLHYLMISARNINPLAVRVRISRWGKKSLALQLYVAT